MGLTVKYYNDTTHAVYTLDSDPTVFNWGNTNASLYAFLYRSDNGTLYMKTGPLTTDWTQVGGSGGGGVGPGTPGTIAMFSGIDSIADSLITDNAGSILIATDLEVSDGIYTPSTIDADGSITTEASLNAVDAFIDTSVFAEDVFANNSVNAPAIAGTSMNARTYEVINFAGSNNATITAGEGSPEGVITAPLGSIYLNLLGGAGASLFVKEGDAGTNTGWVAK